MNVIKMMEKKGYTMTFIGTWKVDGERCVDYKVKVNFDNPENSKVKIKKNFDTPLREIKVIWDNLHLFPKEVYPSLLRSIFKCGDGYDLTPHIEIKIVNPLSPNIELHIAIKNRPHSEALKAGIACQRKMLEQDKELQEWLPYLSPLVKENSGKELASKFKRHTPGKVSIVLADQGKTMFAKKLTFERLRQSDFLAFYIPCSTTGSPDKLLEEGLARYGLSSSVLEELKTKRVLFVFDDAHLTWIYRDKINLYKENKLHLFPNAEIVFTALKEILKMGDDKYFSGIGDSPDVLRVADFDDTMPERFFSHYIAERKKEKNAQGSFWEEPAQYVEAIKKWRLAGKLPYDNLVRTAQLLSPQQVGDADDVSWQEERLNQWICRQILSSHSQQIETHSTPQDYLNYALLIADHFTKAFNGITCWFDVKICKDADGQYVNHYIKRLQEKIEKLDPKESLAEITAAVKDIEMARTSMAALERDLLDPLRAHLWHGCHLIKGSQLIRQKSLIAYKHQEIFEHLQKINANDALKRQLETLLAGPYP